MGGEVHMVLTYELQENNSAIEYYQLTKWLADKMQNQTQIIDEYVLLFAKYVADNQLESARKS